MKPYLLHIDAVAGAAKDQARLHGLCKAFRLQTNLLLLFLWEIDKVVVFCADEKRDCGLVEAPALAVPLLDGIEGALAGEVEHEEDCDGVVADEGQHVDEFALAAQIPYGEGDFGIPDADCLFHKVDACGC